MTLVGPLTLVMGEDNGKNAASASGSPLAGENKFDVIHEKSLKKRKQSMTCHNLCQYTIHVGLYACTR